MRNKDHFIFLFQVGEKKESSHPLSRSRGLHLKTMSELGQLVSASRGARELGVWGHHCSRSVLFLGEQLSPRRDCGGDWFSCHQRTSTPLGPCCELAPLPHWDTVIFQRGSSDEGKALRDSDTQNMGTHGCLRASDIDSGKCWRQAAESSLERGRLPCCMASAHLHPPRPCVTSTCPVRATCLTSSCSICSCSWYCFMSYSSSEASWVSEAKNSSISAR